MKSKRFFALTLAAAVTATLFSGCGKAAPQTGTDPAGTAQTTASASAAGGAGETLKIGMLAPLTGGAAQYGVAVANGVRLYVKEVNASGGVNGKQIELVEYDEEGDAAKAVTGYNHLVDQKVVGIVGDVTTGPTVAVVAESQADQMPMITASATAASVTQSEDGTVYQNMFRSCFIDPFQGEKMASFCVEKLGKKTAAVLVNSGSDYSGGCAAAFAEKAEALGMKIVATESYAANSVDFQGQLTNIAAKNPEVLFVPDYYDVIALVAQQAKDAGVAATMVGVDGWDTVLSAVSDPALVEGAYYCSGYSAQDTTEAVQTFLKAYQAEYGAEPNMFAAQAYDAAKILLAAVEKADAAGDVSHEAVIANLKATDLDCVTGHVVFNESNNPEKTAVIISITDGEAKYWGNY